ARGVHLAAPYADAIFHHCFPYPNVVRNGLAALYRQAEAQLPDCTTPGETEFLACAMRSLLAVKRIAEKFADAAAARLETATDPAARRHLEWIARTAREVPWRPCRTFHEGLNTVWFLYEVCGSIEGIVSSLLGHLDLTLGELYRQDREAGRLTGEEAYGLVARFLMLAEAKYDMDKPVKDSVNGQEMATAITLGGCDGEGREICNELTFLLLDVHHDLRLHFPKVHCRISRHSPPDYLAAINRNFAEGRNTLALLNDDGLIPAQAKAGKHLEDARRYVAGGCWEVMIEGCEHSAGASNYFNLLRILEFSIHDHAAIEAEVGLACTRLDGAESFEEVYRRVLGNILAAIRKMCHAIGRYGSVWPQVNPSPFFSAGLADCLENRRDYTAGGGRYNPHGLPLAGFANLIDSLLAIRTLCFGNRPHSLADLLAAVRANWEGHEALRAEALAAPHYGDNSPASNALAKRLLDDLHASTRDLTNERGGPFQLGIYVYKEILWWGQKMSATPDGRRAGDVFEPGLVPSRLRRNEITSTIHSAAALDLSRCPADSLLTLSLPLGGTDLATLAALERNFAASGVGMLQINCVNRDELIDARKHPERHQDLVVRVAGYSVRFVLLEPEWQDEIISRTIYGRTA
ncbi:MAG: pyruvate formate lyase family protein, partial [Lentisphaeria bacterium]|nr:pyruvate formate lyase family protein [Lentisphaeria bacterium]